MPLARLARVLNVSRTAVYGWEAEDYAPTGENLEGLESVLGFSPGYLKAICSK
jgi:DNA-binding transcriptional regulator YiaG